MGVHGREFKHRGRSRCAIAKCKRGGPPAARNGKLPAQAGLTLWRCVARLAERAKHAGEEAKTANVESTSTAVATANSASRPQAEAVSGPGGFLAAKKSSRTEYAVEGIISFVESNAASSGKVTLSVNNTGVKFQYSSLNKSYVLRTAKEDSGQAAACTDSKGGRARLYFYQTEDRPHAGELNTIQFF